MYDVITIGSATLDVILPCPEMHKETDEHNKPVLMLPHGTKIEIKGVSFETGGGSTNTATTFARQGFNSAVIAKIGKDLPGDKVITGLQDEHIDTSFVIIDPNDVTNFTTIIYSPGQGSALLISRGEKKLEVDHIPWDKLKTKWFFVSAVNGNLEILEKLGNMCSAGINGTKIAWNPGKQELLKSPHLTNLLPCIELFIINRNEASLLTHIPWENIHELLHKVASFPAHTKLITDGQRGAYYFDGNNWWHSEAFHVENPEVTGAGDAFGSGFITGKLHNFSTEQCLHLAAANSANVVSYLGAKKGILTKDQNDQWFKRIIEIKKL